MKCQYCGGDISLDDQICPHCGRLQENAVRHDQEMKRYETAFENTRQEVLDQARQQSARGIGLRLLVILLLLGASVALLINSDAWTVRRARRTREANASIPEFTQKIENYLEERDYIGLSSFEDYYDLMYNDNFQKYYMIFIAADDYSRVCTSLRSFVYSDPSKLASGEMDYYAQQLPTYLNTYYKSTEPEEYRWIMKIDEEKTKEVIAQMDEDLSGLLMAHLGILPKQAKALRSMSDGQRTVLIEEAEKDAGLQKQISSE